MPATRPSGSFAAVSARLPRRRWCRSSRSSSGATGACARTCSTPDCRRMIWTVRRRVSANRLLAAAVVVAVLAPSASGVQSNAADGRLDRALSRLVSMPGGPPGVVAVVQRGTQRIVLKHGVAARSPRRSIALGDHWRIASVSKAFSGGVALTLVGRGRLHLDDTIGQRLPGLPKAWRKVTLAQALHHTSGLPDYSTSPSSVK